MVFNCIIVRCGEIFLKGRNRGVFERALHTNIAAKTTQHLQSKLQGRFILPYFADYDQLRLVFGLTSYSPALKTTKTITAIQVAALSLLSQKSGYFKVAASRADKTFPHRSPEINKLVGEYIEQHTTLQFKLHHPEITLGIEINRDGAYLFLEKIPGRGGLPVGVEGTIGLLLEDEASILAGLLMMKRGCDICLITLHQPKQAALLQQFSPKPLPSTTVADFKQLEHYARQEDLTTLVSGQHFGTYGPYQTNLVTLRPLIAYTWERIARELEEFNSLSASHTHPRLLLLKQP